MVELSEQETASWCAELIQNFNKKQIVLLYGTVGAGKTSLVKKILLQLGSMASSPTYSLINQYQTKMNQPVYHVDLYRLKDEDDLESTGFWDLFSEPEALIFIEWPEKISINDLPLDWSTQSIRIEHAGDLSKRKYFIER